MSSPAPSRFVLVSFDILGIVLVAWVSSWRSPSALQIHTVRCGGRVLQQFTVSSTSLVYSVRVPGLDSEYGTWPHAFSTAPVTNSSF